MLDWLKAVGMCLIVYGHVAAGTTIVLTPPVYLKQFGVTMFLFATAYTLARETRSSGLVLFNRLFRMYLFAAGFAVVMSVATAMNGDGLALSNYFPLLGGANVLFDNFPANPTTWYVGTYLHFLVLWALILRRVNVRPWMVVAAVLVEIPVRMMLITVGGGYVAYMALTNWITVFLFGLMMGGSGSKTLPPRGAWKFVVALLAGLFVSGVAWQQLVRPTPTFPFMTIEGAGLAGLLLVSSAVSFIYFGVTWMAFQAARRAPAPVPVRFISRNSLVIFVFHMPLVFALQPWLVTQGLGYWPRVIITLLVMVPGLALLSEFLNAVLQPDVLRDRIWAFFTTERVSVSRSRRNFSVPVIAALIVGGTAAVAEAAPEQEQQASPAIFGQTPDTNRPITLINASVFSGTGESLVGDDGVNPSAVTQSTYMGLQTTGTFSRRNPNRMFSASAATAVRYFPSTSELITIDRSARVGLVTRIGTRGSFSASQSVQYSPYHQFGQPGSDPTEFEGQSPLSNADGALSVGRTSYDLGTAVGFERSFRRASLSLGYTSRLNLYSDPAENMSTHRAAVGFKLNLWRYAALVIGTASRFGQTGAEAPSTRTQDIDFGIDYNRALSFSRKTTVTFTTGTTVVSRSGTSADPLDIGRQFRMLANVGVSRAIGRYWEARVSYDRNLQFVDAFPDPFFTDGVITRLSGPISRRVNLLVQADYTAGKSVDAEAVELDKTFRGGRAQARVNVAVSRFWQLYAEYYYSENHLSVAALQALPDGLVPRKYARGLRVGLNLWAPKVHK